MNIRIGSPATGQNFYKRPALIAKLLRALRRGNVAFLGPRRTGKTSCLEEIKANPDGFIPILMDLEKFDDVESWLKAMVAELREALEKPASKLNVATGEIASWLGRIQKIAVPGFGGFEMKERKANLPWRHAADEFLKLLAETNMPVLFLLDEFPTFLTLVAKKTSRDEVEAVLNWFRAARAELKDCQARFLVTGSIGLKGVVRRFGLAPSVNEFDTHEIPPLTTQEADGLLETLARDQGLHLSASGRKHILKLLGANWPILLQLFVAEIEAAEFKKSPTSDELERIYRERLVHGSRNQYCDGMYDRLGEVFISQPEFLLARAILKAACRSGEGMSREDYEKVHVQLLGPSGTLALTGRELDDVLETLKHDGYLLHEVSGDQGTRFASNILRDFWIRKTA